MSIVCVQYGQCGNQVGNSLYNTINEDIKNKDQNSVYCKKIVNKWFNVTKQGKWEPRSVLVDTELKAVESQYKLPFKFKNVASKALGGSANNWAFGYVNNSRILKNEILDTIRSEIEKCDYMTSIVNILSSSGGTGSGLGTRIIESLRDEYSTKNFTNVIVLPYLKGEIVTQSYNCILALSHLYSLADNTILFQNEKLHHVCNFNLDIKDITMKNINTVIAQQLVSIFQPIKNVNTCDMLSELCCHRDYKYLQVKNEPIFYENMHKYESDSKWKVLVNSLTKQSRFEYNQQVQLKQPLKTKNICSLLVSRGIDQCPESDTNILRDKKLYVPWITPTETFKHHHEPNKFLSLNRSLTQITNSNQVYFPLNSIVEDAWNLFTHQAYLHHYKKFGIDEDFFLNSFQTMENIICDYKNL